jgi:asparagine synthase (glutamine-hydrolysing)
MCGICGVLGVERGDEAEAIVRRMMAAMHQRGPDDEGVLIAPPRAPGASLGMRRLSIIDLAGGHQPVFNEEGDVAVVFNGEIYNFRELRQTLTDRGHLFRTRSDTEAIVHAYETWGEDCVHHLRGMFAFAVLDARTQSSGPARLFLARDRLGIKPLYYSWANGILLFASEVRALLASRRVSPRLSEEALEAYLLFGSVCEPMTLVEGIFSLPPGHAMVVPLSPTGAGQVVRPKVYWDLAQAARSSPEPPPRELRAAARQARPLLEDAVRSHLIADVPLGIFLSSGLDSTAVVALASREQKGIHTFTVSFPELEYNEAALARQTAERYGTQHEELMLSGEQMLERMDEAVAALDQPTMDGINTYFVSWAARQVGLKVALSGLGGDEVFGGYHTFRATPRARGLAALGTRLPRAVRSVTAPAVARLGARRGRADAARKLAALWRNSDSLPHPYFFVRALFTPEQAATLRSRTPSPAPGESLWRAWLEQTARQAERLDSFTGVSYLETRSYLVNTLLRDTDAVSMSHSLEVRVPLLDYCLVEFVARLPAVAKQRRGLPKALLVEALRELLPEEAVRQRKRTFTFPWEHWLRGPLGEKVAEGLVHLSPALQATLDQAAVRMVWHDFLAGRTNWSRPWSLYVLNEWARRNLAGASAAEAARPAVALAGGAESGTAQSHRKASH